ncbi:MAG: type II toxin-antitoxin system PemK/MazF family toxin [Candidatus Diapherotrites archaeon]
MYEAGDVVLSHIPFTDSAQIKVRPALILYEYYGNFVVAGITSNEKMHGVPVSTSEGLPFDSIIKTNYIFSVTAHSIEKRLIKLSNAKCKEVYRALITHLRHLNRV